MMLVSVPRPTKVDSRHIDFDIATDIGGDVDSNTKVKREEDHDSCESLSSEAHDHDQREHHRSFWSGAARGKGEGKPASGGSRAKGKKGKWKRN